MTYESGEYGNGGGYRVEKESTYFGPQAGSGFFYKLMNDLTPFPYTYPT